MRFGNVPPTLASIVAGLGYTPVNKAGDTMTGNLLFTDATYDIGATGATRPRDGFFSRNLTIGSTLTAGTSTMSNSGYTIGQSTGAYTAPAGGSFRFSTRGDFLASADGVFFMANIAGTSFTRLAFGDVTSSHPAIAKVNAGLEAQLGDGSARTSFAASVTKTNVVTVANLPAAASNAGAVAQVSDASTTLVLGLGGVVTGLGGNFAPVWCDGTNWRYG